MDTKIIVDMLENNKSHPEVMERILSGQDLKPEINQFTVVDPHFWYSPLRTLPEFENARCDMREYPKWKFMNKNNPNIRGIFFSRIKNIFVNPDLGREGIHSMKKATLNSPQVKIIKKINSSLYEFGLSWSESCRSVLTSYHAK